LFHARSVRRAVWRTVRPGCPPPPLGRMVMKMLRGRQALRVQEEGHGRAHGVRCSA